LGVLAIVAGLPATGFGEVPHQINYQGFLTDASGNPLNGDYQIAFAIYNVLSGGEALWSEVQTVSLERGIYNTKVPHNPLTNPLPAGLYDGQSWLGVTVESDAEMEPRQQFLSVAYALVAAEAEEADTVGGLDASALDQSSHVSDMSNPHNVSAAQVGAVAQSELAAHQSNAAAHHAKTVDASELTTGVLSSTLVADDIARDSEITWSNLSGIPAGFADGVDNNSGGDVTSVTAGIGLSGGGFTGAVALDVDIPFILKDSTSNGLIRGENNYSGFGIGVYGFAANGYGVQGKANGNGSGVYGEAIGDGATTNYGGRFIAHGDYGRGVYGYAQENGAVTNYGGYFQSSALYGRGVYGYASNPGSGTNYGGNFRADGSTGRAVYGYAYNSGSTQNYGGYFEARGSSGRGVYGVASNSGSGTKYGGRFQANGEDGVGVYGYAGSGIGVQGSGSIGGYFSSVLGYGLIVNGGRAGIGTTSPDAMLEVNGDGSNWRNGFLFLKNDDNDAGIRIYDSDSTVAHHIFNSNGANDTLRIAPQGNYNGGISVTQDGHVHVPVLVIEGGADLSEHFEVSSLKDRLLPEPGMLVSIDPENPGELLMSHNAYDKKVAGIISGAGGVKPGMLMGHKGTIADGNYPVALSGRVYCKADADHGAIAPGDLLTTSNTPGHAMKVVNYPRAQGAIIGKAMSSLNKGKGLVLVLVTLQ
jgi:hypothetical protein